MIYFHFSFVIEFKSEKIKFEGKDKLQKPSTSHERNRGEEKCFADAHYSVIFIYHVV